MFQMSAIGPMAGQWNHFRQVKGKGDQSYGVERFANETIRLFGVLNSRLSNRTFIVGEELTVADMCFFPWVKLMFGKFGNGNTNLKRWLDMLSDRPAFAKGMTLGREVLSSNEAKL